MGISLQKPNGGQVYVYKLSAFLSSMFGLRILFVIHVSLKEKGSLPWTYHMDHSTHEPHSNVMDRIPYGPHTRPLGLN